MSSRSLIVLGVVATFLVLVFASLSVGFGSNNYLFHNGSTPLTGDWDIHGFYILNCTYENWLHFDTVGSASRDHVFILKQNYTSQDRRVTKLLVDVYPSPGVDKWLNISLSDGTNFMWVNLTGTDTYDCTSVGAFDLDVSVEDLTILHDETAGGNVHHVNVIVQWHYKENE